MIMYKERNHADNLDINLLTAAQRKIEVNERKYSVEKLRVVQRNIRSMFECC